MQHWKFFRTRRGNARFLYYSEGSSLNIIPRISRFTVGRVKLFNLGRLMTNRSTTVPSTAAFSPGKSSGRKNHGSSYNRIQLLIKTRWNDTPNARQKNLGKGVGRKWKEQSVVRGQRCEAPDYGFFPHPFRWRAIINGKFGEATIVRREDGGGRQKNGR